MIKSITLFGWRVSHKHILKLRNQVCSNLEDRHGQTINNQKLCKFTEAIEMWEKF